MASTIHPDLQPYIARASKARHLILSILLVILVLVEIAVYLLAEEPSSPWFIIPLIAYAWLISGVWPLVLRRRANEALLAKRAFSAQVKVTLEEVDGGFDYMVYILDSSGIPAKIEPSFRVEPPLIPDAFSQYLHRADQGSVYLDRQMTEVVAVKVHNVLLLPG